MGSPSPVERARCAAEDAFGYSVDVSGDTVIVGAYGTDLPDPRSGSAYVFLRSGTTWTLQSELTSGKANGRFGEAVAGDRAVVGAVREQNAQGVATGVVHVFARSQGQWTEQAALAGATTRAGDLFGAAVALDGDTLLVGAPEHDLEGRHDAGAAYVFVRTPSSWTEQATLQAADSAPSDSVGAAVALSGDTALVGAPDDTFSGHYTAGSAYVFARFGTTWVQQAKLSASDPRAATGFGISVALQGGTALIGAWGLHARGAEGAAYVFSRLGSTWTRRTQLLASPDSGCVLFGESMAIDGATLVVGAPDAPPGGAVGVYST